MLYKDCKSQRHSKTGIAFSSFMQGQKLVLAGARKLKPTFESNNAVRLAVSAGKDSSANSNIG